MKYFGIIVLLFVFFIGLAMQNMEVVKIRIEYKRLIKEASELYRIKDMLMYRIEQYKHIGRVSAKALEEGCETIGPENIVVIETGKK